MTCNQNKWLSSQPGPVTEEEEWLNILFKGNMVSGDIMCLQSTRGIFVVAVSWLDYYSGRGTDSSPVSLLYRLICLSLFSCFPVSVCIKFYDEAIGLTNSKMHHVDMNPKHAAGRLILFEIFTLPFWLSLHETVHSVAESMNKVSGWLQWR